MTDAAARELLAAFVQLLESLERSNTVLRALLTAHEAGRRPTDAVIAQHREQCDVVEERIRNLRAMLATLSRDL